ncbi:MAG TPA: alpha-hydroxy acid oxidase [Ktedonosporobacter sp.]|nr:alpha-hydroxy acid oxidase [Ktedonosporobacter sp.]
MEPVNVSDYETLARERIEPILWDYYMGGSDDEVTLRVNRSAFERIQLRPRMLVDVSTCSTNTTVLGTPISMPILIAPTACHGFAHSEGECETARGAGQADTLMAVSTVANRSIEEIAEAAGGPLWFQLYVYDDNRITADLVQRAEQAGYRAIVLTVDAPRFARRERDIRNGLILPPPPHRIANFKVDDITRLKPSLTWKDIAWLRTLTSLPILIKGVLTAEDALLAIEHGLDGIIVSNHGGRQLDGAIASITALPEIVTAVAGRSEVYLDGGIRRGTDIIKALALGARAVLVGRPVLWGLAAEGATGVYRVLEMLRIELELVMALSGRPTLESVDRTLVTL